jgi:hypothetical protein
MDKRDASLPKSSNWRLTITPRIRDPDRVDHYEFRVYSWPDFLCDLGGLIFLIYAVMSVFIPANQLLMDKLARRTLKI